MANDKKYAISIIIPTFNSSDSFQKILSSVVNQTRNDVEIIVVDESVKEDLESNKKCILLTNDERIKHIIRRDRKGADFAFKVGIKNSTGESIALLYNKELWKNGKEKNGLLDVFVSKLKG